MKSTLSRSLRHHSPKALLAAVIFSAAFSGSANAACGTQNTYLSQAQLTTVLQGNYACGQKGGSMANGWNERHAGGSLIEEHEGGATRETVGTYTIGPSGGVGRVPYSYSGGVTTTYEVATAGTNCSSNGAACTSVPQNYQFCGVGTANLNIRVSPSSSPVGCPNN